MPELHPFIAASAGALKHLFTNPLVEKMEQAAAQGLFKDIWGSEWQNFMGISSGDSGEIPDNTVGRQRAFSSDVSIYRCVDIRGGAIASVPLKIFDTVDPYTRKEVQHEALGVVQNTNPVNGTPRGTQLMRYSLGARDLHGSFAWNIVYDQGGRLRNPLPRELYWMPPMQYKPVAGSELNPPQPKVPFVGLKVRPGQGKPEVIIPAQNLVYVPAANLADPIRGTSKISALRTQLNLRMYGQNSNLYFFRNNQRPDVVVTGAFNPTIENVSLMRRIWKAAFGGDNQRGPAFLPHDMDVKLLTIAPKDAEWLGQQHAALMDILAAFGVPPPVYGDLSRATYENIRTAYEQFWRTSMIAELDEIADQLTLQLLWKWPDAQRAKLVFRFDYAQIEALFEDANALWERGLNFMEQIGKQVERRMMVPNQARAAITAAAKFMGLPVDPWAGQVPGGDMLYIRFQEVPIIEASVQANVDIMAARAAVTGGETNKPGNGKWTLPDATSVKAPLLPRGGQAQPAQPQQPAQNGSKQLPPDDMRRLQSQDWMLRRLKRHFQEHQTATMRWLRTGDLTFMDSWTVMALPNLETILREGSEIAGIEIPADEIRQKAYQIHTSMIERINEAVRSEQSDPKRAQSRVLATFRLAIEGQAAQIAKDLAQPEMAMS